MTLKKITINYRSLIMSITKDLNKIEFTPLEVGFSRYSSTFVSL